VPAFNEVDTVGRCLAALRRQSVAPFEVIVIDNMSTDGTLEHARALATDDPSVTVITQNAAQGLVPTRDRGFDAARGDVLARIDADTVVSADWVRQLALSFTRPGVAATTGPVGYYDLPLATVMRQVDDFARRAITTVCGAPFLYGSNMALRRSAWRSIRSSVCSDPDDLFHEDIDLAVHLARHGLPIGYTPRMVATVSARRMGDSAAEFADYTRRFDRTLDAHGVRHASLRVTGALLRRAYPVLHHAHRYEVRRAAAA